MSSRFEGVRLPDLREELRKKCKTRKEIERCDRQVLLDFSLTVKVATLIFISGRGSAISSAKEGKEIFINNLVKS